FILHVSHDLIFFFQAEDGIRDRNVTGVQTCALPILVQFFRGIPRELDEAARTDGAGHGRIFFRVILPLSLPALATTAIFTFIWTWNDFFSQLIFLTDPEMYTVPISLRSFLDSTGECLWRLMFVMSVVSFIQLFL